MFHLDDICIPPVVHVLLVERTTGVGKVNRKNFSSLSRHTRTRNHPMKSLHGKIQNRQKIYIIQWNSFPQDDVMAAGIDGN